MPSVTYNRALSAVWKSEGEGGLSCPFADCFLWLRITVLALGKLGERMDGLENSGGRHGMWLQERCSPSSIATRYSLTASSCHCVSVCDN